MDEQTFPASGRSYDGMTRPAQDGSPFTTSPNGASNEPPPRWRQGSLSGERVGDYQLGALLGVGGMAEVYRAEDLVLQREVAVKVLATQLADDADAVKRFRAEARRVGGISHPHLVPVYYAGEAEVRGKRLLYLVMPLLRESLRDLRQRAGKLPATEAAWLVLQVAEGLEAAHRSGIIHRDVKPGNVLLDAEGHPLLTDFGIARELCAPPSDGAATENGLVVGTPGYMAPEQLCGDTVDQRADVYALGAVFYELLTGQRPFVGATPYDLAAHVLHMPLTPPSVLEPDIPPAVEQVVLTALARNPAQRYGSAAEFAQALRQAFTSPSPRKAPRRLDLSTLPLAASLRRGNSLPPATQLPYADLDATWRTGGWRIGRWGTGRARHPWPQSLLIALVFLVCAGSSGVLAMLQSGVGPLAGAPTSNRGTFDSSRAVPIGRSITLGERAPSIIAPGSETGSAPASFAAPRPHAKHGEKHGDESGGKSHGKSGHHDSGND
ncbi:MAG: serine/threonine-protein kinase [Nitrososphaerota archaeon]